LEKEKIGKIWKLKNWEIGKYRDENWKIGKLNGNGKI